MTNKLMRNRTTQQSRVPQPPKRRSIFDAKWSRKQTMNASYITPIMCKKVVPGSTFFLNLDTFARLNTQITCPIDNLQLSTYFFWVPERICWENHKYFIGAVKDPNAETQPTYITPQIEIPAEKNTANSLFNLLSASRLNTKVKVSAIPFRAHNLIWNEYFRDPDCQSPKFFTTEDSDDNIANYDLYRIHKSRDYFTNSTRDISQGEALTIPIGTTAPVIGNGYGLGIMGADENGRTIAHMLGSLDFHGESDEQLIYTTTTDSVEVGTNATVLRQGNDNTCTVTGVTTDPTKSGLIADLTKTAGATLDALRQTIMTQEYLEALNRGGTKYTDVMKNIFDVTIPDLTIQRPMYLGGQTVPLFTNPVIQTSGSQITGSDTPQGNIAGYGTTGDSGRVINSSFSEFGYIIGYAVVKAQPQYQQGLDRQWTEKDKFEYFNPFFNNASDQAIKKQEIFVQDYDIVNENGTPVNEEVFAYIGMNDWLRYFKNEIAGELNSEYKYSLDSWHYAEKFEEAPENNSDFMEDKTYEILDRSMAVVWENKIGEDENGDPITPDGEELVKSPQLIFDSMFKGVVTLPIPTHAVPKISGLL